MNFVNFIKITLAMATLAVTSFGLQAAGYAIRVDGHIDGYEIQGAPDLGIAIGDAFTGTFQYWDGHHNLNPDGSIRYDGSFTYDHFLATIEVDGVVFQTRSDAHASLFGGDMLGGGGSATLMSSSLDYSPYFSQMSLDTINFFRNFAAFEVDASGGPSVLAPNGSSLHVSGWIDSTSPAPFTAPDPVRTDGLLLLALLVLAMAHRSIKRICGQPR